MKTILRSIAALELLFVIPAVLFLTALFARSIQPLQYEPAHTAQRIVDWYAARPYIGLWVLLIALPLAVVVIGSLSLHREWHRNRELRDSTLRTIGFIRSQAHTILIAGATAMAGGILAIVALHVLTD
jgi:ABC-type spermidine/putrescine transport system permease subunit II